MGLSLSWIAVRGLSRETIAARLDAVDTGAPDKSDSARLSLAEQATGWTIVQSQDFDFPTPKRLLRLSDGAEVVAAQIEEHAMFSAAYGFLDNAHVWSVVRDPYGGRYNLLVEGVAPLELAAIAGKLRREQDEEGGEDASVDFIFDVAPTLVEKLCGYRPDGDTALSFTELRPIRRGLFEKLRGLFERG